MGDPDDDAVGPLHLEPYGGRVGLTRGSVRRMVRRQLARFGDDGPGTPPRRIASPSLAASGDTGALPATRDLGADRFTLGEKLAYDVLISELPSLMAEVLSAARAREARCLVDYRGRTEPLTSSTLRAVIGRVRRGPVFRIVVVGRDGVLQQNLCVRVWQSGSASLRALGDAAPIGRIASGSATDAVVPRRTDATIDFPIDAVYLWVNANDPAWRALAAEHLDLATLDMDRFAQSDELRYSLRSLDLLAPWIRRIHVLTNCAPPDWFVPSDRVRWVDHREVVDAVHLPLFNSRAIETFVHRLPDLAEHFLYLNDDVMLWDSVFPSDFFTFDGKTVSYLAAQGSVIYWLQRMEQGIAADWQAARVNGALLMHERYGFLPTRQHEHVPHALRRSSIQTLERELAAEFEANRRSRLRSPRDVSLITFVYHHWSLLQGRAIPRVARQVTVGAGARGKLDRERLERAQFVCLNDTRGSATDPIASRFKRDLLGGRFPVPSSAEGTGPSGKPI